MPVIPSAEGPAGCRINHGEVHDLQYGAGLLSRHICGLAPAEGLHPVTVRKAVIGHLKTDIADIDASRCRMIQRLKRLSCLQAPKRHFAIGSPRQKRLAIVLDFDTLQVISEFEALDLLPRLKAPHARKSVRAPGQHGGALFEELGPRHETALLKAQEITAITRIPDACRFIHPPGDNTRAFRKLRGADDKVTMIHVQSQSAIQRPARQGRPIHDGHIAGATQDRLRQFQIERLGGECGRDFDVRPALRHRDEIDDTQPTSRARFTQHNCERAVS